MLTYRLVENEDAHHLLKWWNDGAVMAHAGFPKGLGLSLGAVEATIDRARAANSLYILLDHDQAIGELSARLVDDKASGGLKTFEIGIKICEVAYQNGGRGRVYLKNLLRDLFIERGAHQVVLDTNSTNKRAQALYEKLGFVRTQDPPHPWKDQLGHDQLSLNYVLTLEDWLCHEPLAVTKDQVKAFLSYHHGFHRAFPYKGEEGFWAYLAKVSCIQFDPIDICGKSPELTVHAHVGDFSKTKLYQLLYEDRSLIDYFDKNLAILPVTDWPLLSPMRARYLEIGKGRTGESDAVDAAEAHVLEWIHRHGYAASKDLKLDQKVDWYWGPTSISRATLERLYFQGVLVIHHKKGTNKYYGLARDLISQDLLDGPSPFKDLDDYHQTMVYRRIRAVGALWAKQSDAFLGILDFKAANRDRAFKVLVQQKKIFPVKVDGMDTPLYIALEDFQTLILALNDPSASAPKVSFIAPLDAMIWDRKLIKALWDFDYKWEIYTPEAQRVYGYYVLPIFYKGAFVGRIALKYAEVRTQLEQTGLWLESTFEQSLKSAKERKNFEEALKLAIRGLEHFHKP